MMPNADYVNQCNRASDELFLAVINGIEGGQHARYQLVRDLVSQGANLHRTFTHELHDVSHQKQLTVLHLAARLGDISWIGPLLDGGADPCVTNSSMWSPTMEAVARGKTRFIEALASAVEARGGLRGGLFKQRDLSCCTPLEQAALVGDVSMVELLLKLGADPNETNHRSETALHLPFLRDRVIEALVDGGANVNHPDDVGITPAHVAARSATSEEFGVFLSKGADLLIDDLSGHTAYDMATSCSGEKAHLARVWRATLDARRAIAEIENSPVGSFLDPA